MQTLARRLETAERQPWPVRPVPITLVITDLDVGGAERALVALATGLDRGRWQPSVIALGAEGALVEPLRAAGVETECLDVDRRRPIPAVRRLARALGARSPWLVQSFLFHANIASRFAATLVGSPWVVGGIRVAEHQKRWHLNLERWTSALSLGSVCVSQGVFEHLRDVGRADPARLAVIPNGIDPRPYDSAIACSRESLGVPADARLMLSVGRLDVQKGLSFLLDAAERVIAAQPNWHLVIVGDGPERDPLHQRAAASRILADRVHWLGRRNDVPALLKAADFLVLASLWEGMPNVVLEAMAARRAVVATAVEGSRELVIPGQTGWLVPAGDSDQLGQALLDAGTDPDRLRRYGEAGRTRVETAYSTQRVVQAYERLWGGILGFTAGAPDSGDCEAAPTLLSD
ncbi:Glycosyltransferase involved in cell wall bisynthesis [Singulisphaera sp. GP187]|uniref:glycosyltransferase n=1 Tax=Singulisphaera sp. GP187 TaxID=1882752 RepID=UPI000925A9D2|nr:glycosyltransferase [Singulisphaera sp. GP187]SIO59172.1 Glycosyltransferase involved in cell wall bisynthesis [Singulisphaera sp. GP187]